MHEILYMHENILQYLLFRRRSKKTLKLRVTGLSVGNSPVSGEIPAQRAINKQNVIFDEIIIYRIWLDMDWKYHTI